jgi:hypothetical protein
MANEGNASRSGTFEPFHSATLAAGGKSMIFRRRFPWRQGY